MPVKLFPLHKYRNMPFILYIDCHTAAHQNKLITVTFPSFTKKKPRGVCLFLFKYSCGEHKACKVRSRAGYVQDCPYIQGKPGWGYKIILSQAEMQEF